MLCVVLWIGEECVEIEIYWMDVQVECVCFDFGCYVFVFGLFDGVELDDVVSVEEYY